MIVPETKGKGTTAGQRTTNQGNYLWIGFSLAIDDAFIRTDDVSLGWQKNEDSKVLQVRN